MKQIPLKDMYPRGGPAWRLRTMHAAGLAGIQWLVVVLPVRTRSCRGTAEDYRKRILPHDHGAAYGVRWDKQRDMEWFASIWFGRIRECARILRAMWLHWPVRTLASRCYCAVGHFDVLDRRVLFSKEWRGMAWDKAQRLLTGTLDGSDDDVRTLRFRPEAYRLLVASRRGTYSHVMGGMRGERVGLEKPSYVPWVRGSRHRAQCPSPLLEGKCLE
ncbi:hypothetical protein F4802DRAFT_331207 [Xylaria palmicola]|nr:hypothetical protein F4802DRAFT_331207 [Xylaria palmicola]